MNFHGGAGNKAYIDFSVNIPPFALSKEYTNMLVYSMEELINYPEIEGLSSKRALGEHFSLSPNCFLIGNGATELIYLVARAYRDKRVLLLEPTFTEYRRAFQSMGNEVFEFNLDKNHEFSLDVQGLKEFLITHDIDILLFCNPNNPTGTLMSVVDMRALLKETKVTLIVDESFLDFIDSEKKIVYDDFWNENLKSERVISIRSLTKNYCVPGIRIAYAMAGEGRIQFLAHFKEPWSVNTFALKSLPYLLKDRSHLENLITWAKEERQFMYKALKAISELKVVKGEGNFFLINCQIPNFLEKLHDQNYHVRTCSDFKGLNDTYYRLTIRTRMENEGLIQAIKEVVNDDAKG